MLRRRFLRGIDSDLRNKIRFKECSNFNELIKKASKYNVAVLEDKEHKQVEFVRAVVAKPSPDVTVLVESVGDLVSVIEKSFKITSINAVTQTNPNPNLPLEYQKHLVNLNNKIW